MLLSAPQETLRSFDRIDAEESLRAYIARHWHILEPNRQFRNGWALGAICEHLEAVTYGQITRLLMNVPPGFMKSLCCNVFWPAWEWGPARLPGNRFINFSYSGHLTERDNRKMRDLIQSRDHRELWGDRYVLTKAGEKLVANNQTGFKLATSVGGVGTGERGDRVVLDDPHNVAEGESDSVRSDTVRWFREAMSNRLNDMEKSAIIVIMQRVHEEDVAGVIIKGEVEDYEKLVIPMEYDGRRYVTGIGWTDPRQHEGELAWPERFPTKAVASLKQTLGPYAYSAQYQQAPTPRGGGIFPYDWWMDWEEDHFPACDYTVASFDGAFGQKQENDYSALSIWGVFKQPEAAAYSRHWSDPENGLARSLVQRTGVPKVILLHAWQKRLRLHGPEQEPQMADETDQQYFKRVSPNWGIVEWTHWSCSRFRVNRLLVEAKANGHDVANEVRRLHAGGKYAVQLIDPGNKLDKVGRAYSVQHILADGMVYAPVNRDWAELVKDQMAHFPKTAHDDITDTACQAWKHLRDIGLIVHAGEMEREIEGQITHKGPTPAPLYGGV